MKQKTSVGFIIAFAIGLSMGNILNRNTDGWRYHKTARGEYRVNKNTGELQTLLSWAKVSEKCRANTYQSTRKQRPLL